MLSNAQATAGHPLVLGQNLPPPLTHLPPPPNTLYIIMTSECPSIVGT